MHFLHLRLFGLVTHQKVSVWSSRDSEGLMVSLLSINSPWQDDMDTASEQGFTGEETRPCKETLEQGMWGKHKSGEKTFPFPWKFWSALWPSALLVKDTQISNTFSASLHLVLWHTSNISAWHVMMLDHISRYTIMYAAKIWSFM